MAKTFKLNIISLDGTVFDGQASLVSLRAIDGDLAIMAGHANYVTAIGMGTAKVVFGDDSTREAACIGGMLSVLDGECKLFADTWEWQDEIDLERAELAKANAQKKLDDIKLSKREQELAEAKLKRALVRISTVK
ncbi:MAG: ATP synthase F1 subunit epsilon [Bacillota bacterium]|nr:ATP synthase F1 subunit epsilon [Bacillota bacterium]